MFSLLSVQLASVSILVCKIPIVEHTVCSRVSSCIYYAIGVNKSIVGQVYLLPMQYLYDILTMKKDSLQSQKTFTKETVYLTRYVPQVAGIPWQVVHDVCNSFGGDLVAIETWEELEVVRQLLHNYISFVYPSLTIEQVAV